MSESYNEHRKLLDDILIDRSRAASVEDLHKILGIDHTPTVLEIIQYLEDLSRFSVVGKLGKECYVNKEALRLAAVYLSDAYIK